MCKKDIGIYIYIYIYIYITFLRIYILFIKQCPLDSMSGNTWWSTKVGAKLLPILVIFSIFSSEIPLDFHESMWLEPLKYLMYFLAGININNFEIFLKKYFAPLLISNLFIYLILYIFCIYLSFVNLLFDITLTFFWYFI